MKSIFTLLGTFLFSLFIENFARIVIIFYQREELIFYGLDAMPGIGWVISLFISVFLGSWLTGMLTVTIVPFSPIKHLSALFILMILWRVSEFSQLSAKDVYYIFGMILTQFAALVTVFILYRKNASKT